MDIRMEKISRGGNTVILLAGELKGAAVTELARLCREASEPLALDLRHLRAAEEGGVRLLRELSGKGVELTGVTPYIALLLR